MSLRVRAAIDPVPLFVALTFTISWGGVVLAVGAGGFPGTPDEFASRLLPVVLAMLAGPSVAALVVVAARGGSALRDLRARAVTLRVARQWYLAAFAIAPLAVTATLVTLWTTSPVFRPGVLSAPDPLQHLFVGLATGLGAGCFEELGWTGVAVPALRQRHTILSTGVIVGVIWGAWHLLVVWWGSTTSAGGVPMSLYLPVMTLSFLPPYRVLMVWVHERTRSVGVAMLMHASLTASVRILDPIGLSGTPLVFYNLALGATLWLVVVVVGRRCDLAPRIAGSNARTT